MVGGGAGGGSIDDARTRDRAVGVAEKRADALEAGAGVTADNAYGCVEGELAEGTRPPVTTVVDVDRAVPIVSSALNSSSSLSCARTVSPEFRGTSRLRRLTEAWTSPDSDESDVGEVEAGDEGRVELEECEKEEE